MPPTPINEGQYSGDWLKWEEDGHYSREVVTIPDQGADGVFESGQVLDDSYDPWLTTATVGGILLYRTPYENGATTEVTIIVRQAVIRQDGLTYTNKGQAQEDGELVTALPALGMLLREGA